MHTVQRLCPLLLTLLTFNAFITDATATDAAPLRVLVMPYILTGNIDTKQDNEHKQRLAMADAELRKRLQAGAKYDLVGGADSSAFSKKVIEALHNNNCNHCEAEFAKPLNVKIIIAPYVYRVSQLVLAMNFVTLDGFTGKIIEKKTLDFRGDNDQSWQKAIQFFVKKYAPPVKG